MCRVLAYVQYRGQSYLRNEFNGQKREKGRSFCFLERGAGNDMMAQESVVVYLVGPTVTPRS